VIFKFWILFSSRILAGKRLAGFSIDSKFNLAKISLTKYQDAYPTCIFQVAFPSSLLSPSRQSLSLYPEYLLCLCPSEEKKKRIFVAAGRKRRTVSLWLEIGNPRSGTDAQKNDPKKRIDGLDSKNRRKKKGSQW